ncbi:exonuclease domain-containing protein [Streptomyces sp. NPDC088915]|uniref:exonuclease domain-containing protein n=1 Tax=Streptomyces sp. NPDC088915 TaxID=3365912 RepID=UPI00380AD616
MAKTKSDASVLRYVGERKVPVYRADRAPEGLLTRGQLREEGLSHAGLEPAGYLHYNSHHGVCPLFERRAARPVRPLTDRQRANLAAGRLLAGTQPCWVCGTRTKWSTRDREERDKPVCGSCLPAVQAAAEKAAADRREAQHQAFLETLAADRRAAGQWARGVLSDPECVIIDSETTGLLPEHPFTVQIAVVTVGGEVLLDTLVNPLVPIPESSTQIHGITDDMVATAPTFSAVLDLLTDALRGRRTVIWNASFDREVFRNELERHFGAQLPPAPVDEERPWLAGRAPAAAVRQASEWLDTFLRADCAMQSYAEWFGEWSPFHQEYTWQRLNGPHNARGDCDVVVRRLRTMSDLSEGQEALPLFSSKDV